MVNRFIRPLALAILVGVGCVGFSASAYAQGDGGQTGGDGGQTGGDNTGGVGQGLDNPIIPAQNNNQTGGGGDAGISEGEGLGEIRTFQIEQSEDTRNQGFVGATAPGIQALFPGAATSNTGSPLADGATFGGGVNSGGGSQFTGGTGGGRAGQAGFGAAQNGVTITRRSIRAKLRPNFSAPQVSGLQIVSRFNDHFYRQPNSQYVTGQYSINIQNRTAILEGNIASREQMDRLVRQLRLEPGVYKIDNRLKVLAQ